MSIQAIIGQHSKSVARAFQKLGISNPVTPKDVLLMTLVHQDRFIDTLVDEVENSSSFDGDGTVLNNLPDFKKILNVRQLPTVEVKATKKRDGTKLRNTLNDILNTVLTGYGTYKGARDAASGRSNQPPTLVERVKKIDPLVWVGIALAILVIVYLIIKNRS